MNDKNFDNMIKAQMAGYNSQLNVEDLWSAIEPSIIKPTFVDGGFLSEVISLILGKKMLFIFATIGICMGTAFIANQYSNSNSNFNNSTNNSPAFIQSDLEENKKEEKIEELNEPTEKIEEIKENNLEKEKQIEEELENENIDIVAQVVPKADKQKNSSQLKIKNNIPSKTAISGLKKTAAKKKQTTIANKPLVEKPQNSIAKNNNPIRFEAAQATQNISFERDESLPLYQFDKAQKEVALEQKNDNSTLLSKEEIKEEKSYPSLNSLKSLNSKSILMKDGLSSDENEVTFIQDCPTFKQTVFKNFVEPYAGVAFAPSILSEKSNELGRTLAGLRDSLETSLETFKTGVLAGAHHKKRNFGVMTGIQFSRIAERMDIETTEVAYNELQNQIIKKAVNLDGDTINIYGTIIEEIRTTKKQKLFNEYRMYDIPLILEYNFQDEFEQRMLYFNVQAGINANFKLNANGSVLDTMQNFVNLDDVARKQLGLTYFASAGVNLAFKNSIVLRAAPTIKVIPKSIMREDYDINQRYNIYGLNFGARWYFSR